jgi:pimeloyl-ACP methyl ester carboxylesterase
VILLHGGLGMGEMYAPVLLLLAKDRRVITVDLVIPFLDAPSLQPPAPPRLPGP